MAETELQEMVESHWAYIEQVIRNEHDSQTAYPEGILFDIDAYCKRIGFHYKSGMMHGFKHGVNWVKAREAIRKSNESIIPVQKVKP